MLEEELPKKSIRSLLKRRLLMAPMTALSNLRSSTRSSTLNSKMKLLLPTSGSSFSNRLREEARELRRIRLERILSSAETPRNTPSSLTLIRDKVTPLHLRRLLKDLSQLPRAQPSRLLRSREKDQSLLL